HRLSVIATTTKEYVSLIEGSSTKLLDTRKTTPTLRMLEKYAVKTGGGENHRFGLFDMIMLKDNHIDFAGGITKAINKTNDYLKANDLDLKIEIEVRNFGELEEVLQCGKVDRIMLDNFSTEDLKQAIEKINHRYETEASGGINKDNIKIYAQTGVDYISVGALTHHISSLDISLVADE
ncbi:MAG: carboxylating nicotinate-nucleotide diphosphorylase, partial [Bacteroidota bacterium]|nr:carboxylating nicotinate-nucleotide diphosphorylase [Bacteroidota bacterium]